MGAIQRVAGTLPLAFDPDYSPARGFLGPRWVTFGRSRVRESRTLGSVGAKAEWLSYPTATRSIGKISWANLVAVTTTDVRGDENAFSSKRSALTRYYLPCRAPSLSARLKAFYLVMGQYDGVVIPSSEAA